MTIWVVSNLATLSSVFCLIFRYPHADQQAKIWNCLTGSLFDVRAVDSLQIFPFNPIQALAEEPSRLERTPVMIHVAPQIAIAGLPDVPVPLRF
jgi:hypothetical protein